MSLPSSVARKDPTQARRETRLELRDLDKRFGDVIASDCINLDVRRGELVTLLGPSGSGKTTILRMVAGYELPTSGKILVDSDDVSGLAPWERKIGVVSQQYALFPHLTVSENIAYGLKHRGWPRKERAGRIAEMLALVQLDGYGKRMPWQLSGGQQQRVALARALAFAPDLLLMDEPLGALDRGLRFQMAEEIRRVHRELSTTIIYVTHDREEALALSDRVAVMRQGRIIEIGQPEKLFNRPLTSFVAKFFGNANLLPLETLDHSWSTLGLLDGDGKLIDHAQATKDGMQVAILPNLLTLEPTSDQLKFSGKVLETLFFGECLQVTCAIDGQRVVARIAPSMGAALQVGASVDLYASASHVVLVQSN